MNNYSYLTLSSHPELVEGQLLNREIIPSLLCFNNLSMTINTFTLTAYFRSKEAIKY
jgi:hypothetical protein